MSATATALSRTGLDDPLLAKLWGVICEHEGFDPNQQPPLYKQLSLAALHDAETTILTYLVSHAQNQQAIRRANYFNQGGCNE